MKLDIARPLITFRRFPRISKIRQSHIYQNASSNESAQKSRAITSFTTIQKIKRLQISIMGIMSRARKSILRYVEWEYFCTFELLYQKIERNRSKTDQKSPTTFGRLVRKEWLKMKKWEEIDQHQTVASKEELSIIDTLSFLESRRIKKGISQSTFARRIGMTQPQLSKIESLDSIPTLTTLNKYARGLGLQSQPPLTKVRGL